MTAQQFIESVKPYAHLVDWNASNFSKRTSVPVKYGFCELVSNAPACSGCLFRIASTKCSLFLCDNSKLNLAELQHLVQQNHLEYLL